MTNEEFLIKKAFDLNAVSVEITAEAQEMIDLIWSERPPLEVLKSTRVQRARLRELKKIHDRISDLFRKHHYLINPARVPEFK